MRFHLIDALRGLAALWVVLFHSHEGGHIDHLYEALPIWLSYAVFDLGHAGVPIFFVISGFVIAHSVARDKVDGTYLAKFTIRRSVRLDPPYWASMLLVICVAWLSSVVKGEGYEWPNIQSVVAHLFYAQGILEIPHFNIIYWTLCLEIQFYLIFCIVIYLIQRLQSRFDESFIAIFSLVAAISMIWPLGVVKDNLYPGIFLPHWHAFLAGCFAYFSWQNRLPNSFFYIYSFSILIASVLLQSDFSIFAMLTSMFVHELAKHGRIASFNWLWLQFLGKISYSLYLTHNPITGACFFIAYKTFGNSIAFQFLAFCANLIICIVFAYIFWWLFERWSMQLSKKITLHRKEEKPASSAQMNVG